MIKLTLGIWYIKTTDVHENDCSSGYSLILLIRYNVCVLFTVVAEKSEISFGRQFCGRPAERNKRRTASVQTSGRSVFCEQKPEQCDWVSV